MQFGSRPAPHPQRGGMPMRACLALGALALILFAAGAAGADTSVVVFVGKTSVPANVRYGRVYAPAEPLLQAMGYSWSPTSDGIQLSHGTPGGPSLQGQTLNFHLGRRKVFPSSYQVNGKPWIDVRALTEGLGGTYVFTASMGVAQVTFPKHRISETSIEQAVSKTQTEARRKQEYEAKHGPSSWRGGTGSGAGESGESGKTKSVGGKKAAADDPISIDRVDFYTTNTGITQGTIVLKNDADKPVRNVAITVTMLSQGDALPTPAADKNGGSAGVPSVAAYVAPPNETKSLPTYGGVPPTTVSNSYPSASGGVSNGDPLNGGTIAAAPYGGLPSPSATPTPSPSPTPTPSPTASPSPTPEPKTVGMLPVLYVTEIAPGETMKIPFQWSNPKRLDVTPSVTTTHDKIEFMRKKDESDEDADKDKDKTDADKSKSEKESDKDKSDKDKGKSDEPNPFMEDKNKASPAPKGDNQ